ncbi:MAG: hypothetical protein FJW32_07625 [Acidobacteria bacterium]|nr:hypothetical protein [Acidobacteriota bacterium]
MEPEQAQWLAVILLLAGLRYYDKRLDDLKDLMRVEMDKAKLELRFERRAREQRILRTLAVVTKV